MRYWLLLYLLCATARAEIENPLTLPLGDRESFMGNSGVSLSGSPGNIFYNPAGLYRLTGTRFSATGSAYALVKGRAQLLGETIDFDTVASVPNMLAITRRIRSWTLAFGIFSPVAIEGSIEAETTVPGPGLRFAVNNVFRTEEQYIGVASGRDIGNGWSFGLGLFMHRYLSRNFTNIFITPDPTAVHITKNERVELEVLSLLPVIGLQKDLTDKLRFGLRIATPDIEILGRSQVHSEELTENAGVVTVTKVREERDGNYRLPPDVSFGLSWTPNGKHFLTADVGVQLPTEFDSMPGQTKGTLYKTDTTVRQSLGYEYHWSDSYSIVTGIMRSPYASGKSRDKEGNATTPTNFFGATLGVYTREKTTTSGAGLFYANARGDGEVLGIQRDKENGFTVYGVLLSTSIDY